MWEKFKIWLFDFGEDMFNFMRTPTAIAIKKYRPIGKEIVIKAASYNGTGEQRFVYACGLLVAEVPGLATYIIETVIQSAYESWAGKDEMLDTDGDGVPDYRDLCKLVGDQGCRVDENGCPIFCQ